MIRRIIKHTLLLSTMLTALLWILKPESLIFSLILGSIWGSVNLFLIETLTLQILFKKNIVMSSSLALIKFPLLYWIGYQLLTFVDKPWFAVMGLSLVFLVLFLAVLVPRQEKLA